MGNFTHVNFGLALKQQQQQRRNEKRQIAHSKYGKAFRFDPYNEQQRRQLQSRTSVHLDKLQSRTSVHLNKLKDDYLYQQKQLDTNIKDINKKYKI